MTTYFTCIGNSDLKYEGERLQRHTDIKQALEGKTQQGFKAQFAVLLDLMGDDFSLLELPILDALIAHFRQSGDPDPRLVLVLSDQAEAEDHHRANDTVDTWPVLKRLLAERHNITAEPATYHGNLKNRAQAFAYGRELAERYDGPLALNHTTGVNDFTQALAAGFALSRKPDEFTLLEAPEVGAGTVVRESGTLPLERSVTVWRVLERASDAADFDTMESALRVLGAKVTAPLAELAGKLGQLRRFELGRFVDTELPSLTRFSEPSQSLLGQLRQVHQDLKSLHHLAHEGAWSELDAHDRARLQRGGSALAAVFLFNLHMAVVRKDAGMLVTLLAAAHEKALSIAASLASGRLLLVRKGLGTLPKSLPKELRAFATGGFWTKQASESYLDLKAKKLLGAVNKYAPEQRLRSLRNGSVLQHGLSDIALDEVQKVTGRNPVDAIDRARLMFEAALGDTVVVQIQPRTLVNVLLTEYAGRMEMLIRGDDQVA